MKIKFKTYFYVLIVLMLLLQVPLFFTGATFNNGMLTESRKTNPLGQDNGIKLFNKTSVIEGGGEYTSALAFYNETILFVGSSKGKIRMYKLFSNGSVNLLTEVNSGGHVINFKFINDTLIASLATSGVKMYTIQGTTLSFLNEYIPPSSNVMDALIIGEYVYAANHVAGIYITDKDSPGLYEYVFSTEGEATSLLSWNNYLIGASGDNGIQVYDLSDPIKKTIISTILDDGDSIILKLVMMNNDTLVAMDPINGIYLFHVTSSGSLVQLSTIPTTSQVRDIATNGNQLAIAMAGGIIEIYSITASASTASWERSFKYQVSSWNVNQVGLHASLDYLIFSAGELGFFVMNWTSSNVIQEAVGLSSSVTKVEEYGGLYFVLGTVWLDILDFTDPLFPSRLYRFNATSGDWIVDFAYSNKSDRLFIATRNNGIQILDVSNPAAITLEQIFDTGGRLQAIETRGDLVFTVDDVNGLSEWLYTPGSTPFLLQKKSSINVAWDLVTWSNVLGIASGEKGIILVDVESFIELSTYRLKNDTMLSLAITEQRFLLVGTTRNGMLILDANSTGALDYVSSRIDYSKKMRYKLPGLITSLDPINDVFVVVSDFYDGVKVLEITVPTSIKEVDSVKENQTIHGDQFQDVSLIKTKTRYMLVANGEKGLELYSIKFRPSIPQIITRDYNNFTKELTIFWRESLDIDGYIVHYEIQLSKNPAFQPQDTSYIYTTALNYTLAINETGTYYYKIRARDNSSLFSLFSDVQSISIVLQNETITGENPSGGNESFIPGFDFISILLAVMTGVFLLSSRKRRVDNLTANDFQKCHD